MLGIGRSSVLICSRDSRGRLDHEALEEELLNLRGKPAILIANAGEVNAGDFDNIEIFADLAEKYNCWLHVDGAFGLFARVSPKTIGLTKGTERAQSITVDGHKWLNVPYDCGFSFVKGQDLLTRTFAYSAAYLPKPDDPHPNFGVLGPESSRRARGLTVWATLRAYGREGYNKLIEKNLALAQYMAQLIDLSPELERLAEVPLNIVCFRMNPGNLSEKELNELNQHLGDAIISDGRVFAGTTEFEGKIALRPALVNWRTGENDVEFFIEVVRELGKAIIRD
jgi:glutamate/tyrosine decarboxylase-like PLP-dependent enzyme